jgi:hypothetical protein
VIVRVMPELNLQEFVANVADGNDGGGPRTWAQGRGGQEGDVVVCYVLGVERN